MTMTQDQFYDWIETEDGSLEYYEWLFDTCPELGKHGLYNAHENGYMIDEFMAIKGVTENV